MEVGDKICLVKEKLQATVHAMTEKLAIVCFIERLPFRRYRTRYKAIRL